MQELVRVKFYLYKVQVKQNSSLLNYNTFGIDAYSKFFAEITSKADLQELYRTVYWNEDKLILGGGSNILLVDDFNGLTVHLNHKGIETIAEDENNITLKVAAGEVWHEFVMHCVEKDYGGLENLSLIPGLVGAAPMQNIGAYGVEQNSCFVELTAFNIVDGEWKTFRAEDCEFGYRNSVFKNIYKGIYLIWDVTYCLTKKDHSLNMSYGAIQQKLEEHGVTEPTIQAIGKAIITIRQNKLPDPTKIGNSGSFFKNPVVPNVIFEAIQAKNESMPFYSMDDKNTKIPAGWLIEQCGWKGKVIGQTGTYKNQALVLVNHGNATGKDVWALAQEILTSVDEKFGIKLVPEVNVIGL